MLTAEQERADGELQFVDPVFSQQAAGQTTATEDNDPLQAVLRQILQSSSPTLQDLVAMKSLI